MVIYPPKAPSEPPTVPSRRRTVPPKDRWIGAALALGCLVVMLAHLRLPYPSDQLNYLTAAERFPRPVPDAAAVHQVTRFGLIVPTRLAITVFGYSQAAYHVVPLLAALALLLGTYAVGGLLFARPVGAAAAVVVLASTPVAYDSTDLLPDVLAAGLFTIALAMAVAIRRRLLSAGPGVLLLLGLLLGWSYLVREFVVFLWPLVAVLVFRRVRWPGLLWAAAPVVALVIAETLLCWAMYGDPLTRLRSVTGHGSGPTTPEIAGTFQDKPRHVYLLRLPTTLNDYPEGVWLVLLLGLTLLGGLLRPRRFAVPVAWLALLWVPLTLLGGIVDPSAPKLRLQLIRYWFPIFPAFVLGGLGLIWLAALAVRRRARDRPGARRAAAALPAAVVLAVAASAAGTAIRGWWAEPGTRVGGGTQLEAFRSWMARHGDGVPAVWADTHTAKTLTVYREGPFGGLAWRAEVLRAAPGGFGPRPGDLVLFYDVDQGRVCGSCRKYARLTWGDPPRPRTGWREVYATRDGMVRAYRVGP
ncbi:hypothetical protein [Actinomadura sp. HBU206391]|uniref:hypothetical protein n=1 Tax=Actinomadura sp. HBU206391 TaxID=2731692 RepID=UPI0016503780|nr:hypothetical protein [Actinomadura sp. HBU206391]MBC6459478.1 hypothetical protein [Actinomadura sp. HBU206391]